MSRSTYVYVVSEFDIPIAAFTVKHELVTWLKEHPVDKVSNPGGTIKLQTPRDVYRIRDNGTHTEHKVELVNEKFLKE